MVCVHRLNALGKGIERVSFDLGSFLFLCYEWERGTDIVVDCTEQE